MQLDFLEEEESFSLTIEERIADAIDVILGLLRKHVPLVVAYSGGKDSSVVANLALTCAAMAVLEGLKPLLVITSSDTLVESPEVRNHVRVEMQKMRRFAKEHKFQLNTAVVTPSLLASWQVKVLSGRGLPSYAGQNTDCSVDLKINPQQSYRNRLFSSLKEKLSAEPVTLLGTRAVDESERRTFRMRMRQDGGFRPVKNETGDWVLSPIAMWDVDSVWEYIGMAASGMIESFSDFNEVKRIYAHAGGTSCAVVSDAILAGKAKKGGCGARLGCWTCQQATDKSLETMIEFDARYAYAAGLNRLNKFIRAIRYDWGRRHYVGRTIRGGYIAIEPDTFSPATVREIFRYMLQLDFDEEQRAEAAGESKRFKILPDEMILTIDAMWSLNGLAPPFAAWVDYLDVFENGVRYDIPETEDVAETPMPATRFLYAREDWDGREVDSAWSGMRDVVVEGFTEGACSPLLKRLPNGQLGWDVPTDQRFDIDAEGLVMFLDFEMRDKVNEFRNHERIAGGITHAYKWYLQYGLVTLSHGLRAEHDLMLRRTAFKDRHGLTMDQDIEELMRKTVGFSDLPEAARKEWRTKGRTETAQLSLRLAA